jgi:hypothetical protein
MNEETFPVHDMKESLRRLETEAKRLRRMGKGMPAVEKNIDPIMTFLDILDFHLSDLRDEDP